MNFREEIQNILRSKGIATALESNQTIFAIATLGLFVGKERLLEIVFNSDTRDRRDFEHRIFSLLESEEEKKIANFVFELIPKEIDERTLIYITEIIVKFDLEHIVTELSLFDDASVRFGESKSYYPVSSVKWINQLVAGIFKLFGGRTLYNNDCGTGDFIMDMLNQFIF